MRFCLKIKLVKVRIFPKNNLKINKYTRILIINGNNIPGIYSDIIIHGIGINGIHSHGISIIGTIVVLPHHGINNGIRWYKHGFMVNHSTCFKNVYC